MDCMSCGYSLELASLVGGAADLPRWRRTEFRCQNCRAEMIVEMRLTKPSPLPPEELKRKTNGVGSHAR